MDPQCQTCSGDPPVRFPRPLRPGDRIGVTSPSTGASGHAAARIDFCVECPGPAGSKTAIDLVDLLDWDLLATAEPTWLVGFSDLSTVMAPRAARLRRRDSPAGSTARQLPLVNGALARVVVDGDVHEITQHLL